MADADVQRPAVRSGVSAPAPWSDARSAMAFVVLSFAISWSAWGVTLALGGDPTASLGAGAAWLLGGFGPPLAAVAVAGLRGRPGELRALLVRLLRWRVQPRWYAVLLVPLVVAVLATVAIGARPTPQASLSTAALLLVPMLLVMAVVGGGQEELGWRGHLLPRAQVLLGPLPASLVVGAVWAAWHLPLYAMTNTTQTDSNLGWFSLGAVALSVILTWLHNGTEGSVLLAVAFHAAVNTSYSTVLGTVGLEEFARFEMAAALGMTAVALAVIWAVGPRLGAADSE